MTLIDSYIHDGCDSGYIPTAIYSLKALLYDDDDETVIRPLRFFLKAGIDDKDGNSVGVFHPDGLILGSGTNQGGSYWVLSVS